MTETLEPAISHFFERAGLSNVKIIKLPGDASTRRYWRLKQEETSRLLMIDPPPTSLSNYIKIQKILKAWDLSVPQIELADVSQGLALIEDFGEMTFTRCLREGQSMRELYLLALDVLFFLRNQCELKVCAEVQALSLDLCFRELQVMLMWYVPQVTGQTVSSEAEDRLTALFAQLYKEVTWSSPILCLRDFHVDNIMLLPKRIGVRQCGLLDFQDAFLAPPAYDVTSLLQDSRVDMPLGLRSELLSLYMGHFEPVCDSGGEESFLRQYHLLGAQRNLKNLGVFFRLAYRDQKPHYLNFVPRLWENLEENLAFSFLAPLKEWVAQYLPRWRS